MTTNKTYPQQKANGKNTCKNYSTPFIQTSIIMSKTSPSTVAVGTDKPSSAIFKKQVKHPKHAGYCKYRNHLSMDNSKFKPAMVDYLNFVSQRFCDRFNGFTNAIKDDLFQRFAIPRDVDGGITVSPQRRKFVQDCIEEGSVKLPSQLQPAEPDRFHPSLRIDTIDVYKFFGDKHDAFIAEHGKVFTPNPGDNEDELEEDQLWHRRELKKRSKDFHDIVIEMASGKHSAEYKTMTDLLEDVMVHVMSKENEKMAQPLWVCEYPYKDPVIEEYIEENNLWFDAPDETMILYEENHKTMPATGVIILAHALKEATGFQSELLKPRRAVSHLKSAQLLEDEEWEFRNCGYVKKFKVNLDYNADVIVVNDDVNQDVVGSEVKVKLEPEPEPTPLA